MKNKLEFQADRIEAVLKMNKIPARVTGGTVTPRWVRFTVLPAIGAKISRIKALSEEMAAALAVSNCRISRRGATVAVEIPRDDPKPVRLLPLYTQLREGGDRAIPPVTAILGLAEDGAPLLIRLPSPDVAHILIAGTTGSGKTMLLQAIALSLALTNDPPSRWPTGEPTRRAECAFVMIDPKGNTFRAMRSLPHLVRPVVVEMADAVEALRSLVRLMERRTNPISTSPRVIVMIDELADLLMIGGKDVQTAITRLTQRGRESGIHVVAATQKPTSAVLGPLVKANFPVRLVGRVMSAEDARTATGWSGTGAERLLGKGDFLSIAEGRVTRFQVAHISQSEVEDTVARISSKPVAYRPAAQTEQPASSASHVHRCIAHLKSVFTPITRPDAETPFLRKPDGPQIVDVEAEEPELGVSILEPEEVLPPAEPEEASPLADKVAGYLQRLTEMEWDASQSYRAACRALAVSQGGKPFQDVKKAIIKMRGETGQDPKGMACARRAIPFVEPNGAGDATASATTEESPTPNHTDVKGLSLDDSGRTVALETQDGSAADEPHRIDEGKLVSIGLAAEVRWDQTPQAQASRLVEELQEYLTIKGEDIIFVTAILVDAIRADRMTSWVKLV